MALATDTNAEIVLKATTLHDVITPVDTPLSLQMHVLIELNVRGGLVLGASM